MSTLLQHADAQALLERTEVSPVTVHAVFCSAVQ